jgi:hypothetical protein
MKREEKGMKREEEGREGARDCKERVIEEILGKC